MIKHLPYGVFQAIPMWNLPLTVLLLNPLLTRFPGLQNIIGVDSNRYDYLVQDKLKKHGLVSFGSIQNYGVLVRLLIVCPLLIL